MVKILSVNPGRKTAVLAVEGGAQPRVVHAEFVKYCLRGNGVRDAIFVGSRRYVTVKVNGQARQEKLPQTFVVPMAAVKAAIGGRQQIAA